MLFQLVTHCPFCFVLKYGFTKLRRGPETDMYAHSSFIRCHPELLSELRKSSSTSRRRPSRVSSDDTDSASSGSRSPDFRSFSPNSASYSTTHFQPIAQKSTGTSEIAVSSPQCVSQTWLTFQSQPMFLSNPQRLNARAEGTGRLDLLALAIERESCLSA